MKKVLITGAASGLGYALAKHYSKQGWSVCVADIQEKKSNALVDELNNEFNNNSFFIKLDVTEQSQWEDAVAQIKTRWQTLDCLINNAGVASSGNIDQIKIEDFQWTVDVNIMGVVKGCHNFTTLIKQSQGSIINIASVAGLIHLPAMSAYNATKAAIIALSETLKSELKSSNVHVSVACPAFFKTNLTDNMRVADSNSIDVVKSLMDKSKFDANDVARVIYEGSQKKKFLVFSHKPEKILWKIKRFIPSLYFKIINKIAKKIEQNKLDSKTA